MDVQDKVKLTAEIFDKYGDTIRSFISLQTDNKSDIDDIYQNLFLSLVHKPVPSHVKNIVGYLYKAITNDIIDTVRRKKSYQIRISDYAICKRNSTIQVNLHSIMTQAEDIKRTIQLIERQLPPHEAQAIIERYKYDHTTSQITKRMHINKRTLSRYLCTGLKKIRQLVSENIVDHEVS